MNVHGSMVVVLCDQLDRAAPALGGMNREEDAAWLAETEDQLSAPWSHKKRIAFLLAAGRHFRRELEEQGIRVLGRQMSTRATRGGHDSFPEQLAQDIKRFRPQRLVLTHPGKWDDLHAIRSVARHADIELHVEPDRHFYVDLPWFQEWSTGRREIRLEDFYRAQRREQGVLLDREGTPEGGKWNFDKDNRESFGREGPPSIRAPRRYAPDAMTKEVLDLVAHRFSDHPGTLDEFDVPVTRRDAQQSLYDFISHRLPTFGSYQDAMHTGRPFLSHSRLSAALNVKLLSPRECVDAVVSAFHKQAAPINSVEGFVRQILGWREFIRGVYWRYMPGYIECNALNCADLDVPSFYWNGQTEMACIAEAMRHVLQHGYAHHIERLMVLGLFAQLLGVHPRRFHDWHMAMYVDAMEWVSLPNVLGMSQFADGGIVGTKPYCASGAYIHRMSNYCSHCRYNPSETQGESACPFTALYWDFLERHRKRFSHNSRMQFQMTNLNRKDREERQAIRKQAESLREQVFQGEPV